MISFRCLLTCLFTVFLGGLSEVLSQTISSTPPAGVFALTAHPNTDSHLSIPLHARSAWIGRIVDAGLSDLEVTGVTVAVDNAFDETSDGPTHYAQFITGHLTGLIYPVHSNEGDTIALKTDGDNLISHPLGALAVGAETGDVVRIIPMWSLGAIFGDTQPDIALAPAADSPGPVFLAGDQLRLPDQITPASHKAPSVVIANVAGSGWEAYPPLTAPLHQVSLAPGASFVVRRHSAESLEVTVLGYVLRQGGVLRIPSPEIGEEMDFEVSLLRPTTATIAGSGLGSVIEPSVDAYALGDSVLLRDHSEPGFAPDASHSLQFTGTDWTEGALSLAATPITPGQGITLRLRGERPVRFWRQPDHE